MSEDFRTQVQDLQRQDPANQSCIECGSPNPQWASVSHGVFVCLECSGTHRSLGVHLSFVRSISMDKWSKDQYAKMQLGGNANFAHYVQQHPDEMARPGMPLKDKYASYPAAVYRAQLTAKVEGKPFDPASVQWTAPSAPSTASASPALGMAGSGSAGMLNGPMVGFGSSSSSPAPGQLSGASPNAFGAGALPTKDQNEDYFARMGQANATRPEHLPPSQGGRYTGFGSTPAPSSPAPGANPFASPFTALNPSDIVNDPMTALSKGWSLFSTVATAAASTVGTVVVKGTQLVQDPNFQSTVQSQVARGATTVGELLTKVGETAMATGTRAYTLLEQQRAAAAAGGATGGTGGGGFGSDSSWGQAGGAMWGAGPAQEQHPAQTNAFGAAPASGGSDFFAQPVPPIGGSGGASPFRSGSPPLPPHQETLIGGDASAGTMSAPVAASVSGASAMQRKATGTGAAKKADDWDEW